MATVACFMRMTVREEPGRVVFALHRSKDDPNEFPTTRRRRARSS